MLFSFFRLPMSDFTMPSDVVQHRSSPGGDFTVILTSRAVAGLLSSTVLGAHLAYLMN
ncbi:hypothetical protein YUWDRAFT_02688 [Streptomyces sp. AmelKG-D3]|nr:hypothetical protein YUWDRAFT_02688 [Streptomyces sp. AmelKG-D3]